MLKRFSLFEKITNSLTYSLSAGLSQPRTKWWYVKKKVYSYIHIIVVLRYQDIHTQSCIMVFASQRWLGVRLDCLSALLTCAVALAAVFVSQDAGKFTSTCNEKRNWLFHVYM